MNPLSKSNRYRTFVNERDKALEQILRNAQADTSRILNEFLDRVVQIAGYYYGQIPQANFFTAQAMKGIQAIEHKIDAAIQEYSIRIVFRIFQLRKDTYLLSATAEGEAIAQAMSTNSLVKIQSSKLNNIAVSKNPQGEDILARVQLSLSQIKRDVASAIQLARVQEESVEDMLVRVKAAFPKAKLVNRPIRTLKPVPIVEADAKIPKRPMSALVVDDKEWDDMLAHYKSTILPDTRFYNEPIKPAAWEGEVIYAWDIEQEMTHDFVNKVRAGQIDAATQKGIKDFIWIAILDDKTDECCSWRDGLTTDEIARLLKTKKSEDECKATVPPAHFNCRCTLAPVGELPERVESNLQDFDEWLNS